MSTSRRIRAAAAQVSDAAFQLPESCEFPQLRDMARGDQLARGIATALARGKRRAPTLLHCAIRKLHYRPGSGCRLVIEARFAGDGEGVEQLYFGRLLTGDGAQRQFEASRRSALTPPRFGPPILFLPEWDLVLWAYPNDPGLPGLALLSDLRRVRERLAASPGDFGLEQPPQAVRARRVKYVPGKRCGYVYSIVGSAGHWRGTRGLRIYGKCYAEGEAARAHDVALRFWRSPARIGGRFLLPRPYACDEEAGIVWQEAFAGRPLLKQRGRTALARGGAFEIGARLAALHATDVDLEEQMTLGFQVEMLRRSIEASRSLPARHARAARELGNHLITMSRRLAELPPATLHGSFRLSHVMASREGLAFIDLDGANRGDPSCDIGHFVAHVLRQGATASMSDSAASRLARSFHALSRVTEPATRGGRMSQASAVVS